MSDVASNAEVVYRPSDDHKWQVVKSVWQEAVLSYFNVTALILAFAKIK
jgi:hypothetical protein